AVFREGNAERVKAIVSSATLFDVLGMHATQGRLFRVDETRRGAAPVALLSYAYWMRAFGGDRKVVGTFVELEGTRYEIIGVLPREAQLPGQTSDLWLALELDPNAPAQNSHYLSAIGRLRDDVSPDEATRVLLAEIRRFPELYPNAYSEKFFKSTGFTISAVSWRDEVVGKVGGALWILFGSVGLVLLIACANVVNLVLVRAESRRREVAVRRALGAEGRHLAWHFIAEGLIVATGAGVAGLAMAWGALRVVVAKAPSAIPRLAEVHLGMESIIFASALVLLATLAFGLVPLWHESGSVAALREGGRGGSAVGPGRRRTRNALVLAQVALSVILLASAGLLLRSAEALRHIKLGFEPDRTLTFAISIPWERYKGHRAVTEFHRDLTSRLSMISGVTHAGVGSLTPLSGHDGCAIVWVEGRPTPPGEEPPCVSNPQVSPGYFESLGIPVRGRARTWDDETAGTDGVVVSAALARRLWPGEDAIGKGIKGNGGTPPFYHVIGVSGDFRVKSLDSPPVEAVHFPLMPIEGAPLWSGARDVTVVIKSSTTSVRTLLPAIRKSLQALDPRIPVANVSTMAEVVENATASTRFVMLLLSLAAAMALTLSAVGMYGVISHLVGQRRNEIGVRMALGARAGDVRAMVVRESFGLALGGVTIGVGGALVATRLLGTMLYGVSPNDPVTLTAVSATLLAVATAASYVPARRASRIDPTEALRGD
ncbi:MAG: ADOP family duplicated permease, partial [Gemmatimonadaceae bacterium]